MRHFGFWLGVLAAGLGASLAPAGEAGRTAEDYHKSAGPSAVETVSYDWRDAKRDREVPVKIYYPKDGDGPFPIIIFSHGLGGSREGYEYLGKQWASWGYVSVHAQHLGSDNAVWQGARPAEIMSDMRKAAANLGNITNRPLDVSFAIDQMEKLNREGPVLRGELDLKRIGVGGHSFGAFTTLAIAGETFPTLKGPGAIFLDPRVKAAMPMSAPVPGMKSRLDQAFSSIKMPCCHMTGTRDSSPIGDTKPEDRRLPFDHINGADQFLVTFNGGDHMIFSGRGRLMAGAKDAAFQSEIRMVSTAFWDAYLKDDAKAKAWLTGDGCSAALGSDAVFEKKLRRD